MKKIILWLFVIFLGITFGAGLYESRVVVSKWTTAADGSPGWDAAAARSDDTGRKFWAFITTGPLTLLTLLSLAVAWRSPGPVRRWWLAAAGTALADRLVTFTYFIPTMIRLMDAADTPQARAAAAQWASLDYVRHGLVLVAWLLALRAFAELHIASAQKEVSS